MKLHMTLRRCSGRPAPLAVALLALAFAVGLAVALAIRGSAQRPATLILHEATPDLAARPISLFEAFDRAQSFAADWPGDWEMASLQSADSSEDWLPDEGSDGRRFGWVAEFHDGTGEERLVRLHGGEPTIALVSGIPAGRGSQNIDVIGLERPALDSFDALALARFRYEGLAAGGDKARGFHFGLVREPIGGSTELFVAGSLDGAPGRIVFSTSGEILRAEQYGLVTSTLLSSADGGRTWGRADVPGHPISVATGANPSTVAYLAATNATGVVEIFELTLSGHWEKVSTLPETVTWVRRLTATEGALYAATDGGIWHMDLSSGTVWFDPALNAIEIAGTPDGTVVAVVVAAPGELRIVRLTPSGEWTPEVAETIVPERLVIAPPDVVAFRRDGPLGATPAALDIAGRNGTLVAVTPDGNLLLRDSAAGSWRPIPLDGPSEAVAIEVFDAWPDDPTLLLGEYRGGLWRSVDAGASWSQTYESQGMLGDIVVTSNGLALAIEIGGIGWVPYDR